MLRQINFRVSAGVRDPLCSVSLCRRLLLEVFILGNCSRKVLRGGPLAVAATMR